MSNITNLKFTEITFNTKITSNLNYYSKLTDIQTKIVLIQNKINLRELQEGCSSKQMEKRTTTILVGREREQQRGKWEREQQQF